MATRLGPPTETVELTHDGETIAARPGESLALALLAADRFLLSRSPKLHRPRGPYCLRGACEGCLVRVDGLPNQPACRTTVRGGEVVETQNVLGSRETDLLSAADFLFPQGIDHHRLMASVPTLSPLVASVARRIAGLGKLADRSPEPTPAEHREVDVLIVGAGRRGLAVAALLGPLATLVDDGARAGGSLQALDPPRAELLRRAALAAGTSLHERRSVVSLSREPQDGSDRITALVVGNDKTLVLRASCVVLATGRHDAVPAFPNNDLPGIFSARAALAAWRGDVLLGRRLAVIGSGRYSEALLQQMKGALEPMPLDERSVVRAIGRERVTGLLVDEGTGVKRIKVDAVTFEGPGAPSFELAVQAGASVDFRPEAGYFPRAGADGTAAPGVLVPHPDPRVTATAARALARKASPTERARDDR